MANYERIILILIFLSIAHFENVCAIDFELCGPDIINLKNGSFFFNISEFASHGEIECRRLIHVDEGYVKLTINTDEAFFQGNNIFQVYDGGFNARKINPEGHKGQEIYKTTGNTMAILLKAEKRSDPSENFVLQGTYISLPFQTTCKCAGIQNGIQRCWESFGVRNCEVTCKNGFVDLTGATGNFSCNLLSGKWDNDLEMRGRGCQSTVLPSVVVHLNLTFQNASICTGKKMSTFIKDYFKGNKNISENGQCFGENNGSNCTAVDCVKKNNSSFVRITIEDKSITKSHPVKEKASVVDLFTIYSSTSFKDIGEQLFTAINKTLQNTSLSNTVENSVQRQCPSGLFLILNAGDIGYPLCSKCPSGSFYKSFKCEVCPNGTFSSEGSESCSLKEVKKIAPLSKDSCKVFCPLGKGLNLKTGFCRWCSNETYQNRTDVLNVNCSACPQGKATLYPGATAIDQCYVPCQKGTFFSLKNKTCQSCPIGTYQEAGNHFHMACKSCDQGKITNTNGSTDPDQCHPSCTKGRYLDSNTSQCLKCPFGSYQNKINQLNCTRCPDGKSTLKNGSSDPKDCHIMCQMGTYFDMQNRSCTECPKGTYMDQNDHLAMSCTKCTGNKTTQGEMSVNETDCLEKCGVGEYLDPQNASCSKCPLGTYMDQKGHLMPSCIKCADNKTTHVQGAGNENHCLHRCGPGEYFAAQNRSCSNCPFGTYMDENYHLIKSCKKCGDVNQTTQEEGAVDKNQCFDKCKAGEYFSAKNSSCELCPLGTYMDENGHLILVCKNCNDKKTTYETGAASETQCMEKCKVGNYFNSTVSSCVVCPKGFYQSKTAQETCLRCPPGMSTRSSGETSDLACVRFLCSQGEYIGRKGKCYPCPKGTYQSAVNHTLSSCQHCPSNISEVQGAKNLNSCVKICDSFPCENGAECIEKADEYCICPHGVTGKRCEIIERQDELIKLEISLRFTYWNWSVELSNTTSSRYREVKYRIETALRNVFMNDESFVAVQVKTFVKGSIIANFDLYMNDNASIVPAKALQIAVRNGSVGGLPVDKGYLNVRQATCGRALGMENGRIEDEQISATSESEGQEASHGRLNSAKGWLAKQLNSQNYLQIVFNSNVNITAIATQGDSVNSFVTAYSLSYKKEGQEWMGVKESINSTFPKNFTGNNDTDTIIKNVLPEPITLVKYIRVIPVTWSNGIGMRIEFYGCILSKDIPTTRPTTPEETTTDPKVKAVASEEDEYSWGKYLGITFGLLMIIGCLAAFFMWWRSSKKKKRKENIPLVMTKQDGKEYRNINKNDELEYDEQTV